MSASVFQSSPDPARLMSSLDWTVFGLVLALTAGAVLYGQLLKRRQLAGSGEKESFLDLLVMGRRLTLPLFVATLVATWYGGIFPVTENAFKYGLYNFVTQGLFWYASYIIFAFFIVQRIQRYRAVTLPDLVGKMFGPRSAVLGGAFTFFNVLPITYLLSLGVFLQALFGGEIWSMMLIGTVFVLLYSSWGGLRAVVFSDLVQFGVMCSAVAVVLLLSIHQFGGWNYLRAELPATHFSPTGPYSWAQTFVWGFLALATLVDPNFYQRCFAADRPQTARRGILISTGIWLCFDICTTFGAMYARTVMPEADAHHAYLFYALQLLPDGLRGFFLAGILATILSTLDSYFFLAGTTLAHDLVPKRWRGKVGLHHAGVILAAGVALGLGILFNSGWLQGDNEEGGLIMAWKILGSYSAACLLLPMLLGYILPGKIRDLQFVCGALCGAAAATVWRLLPREGFWADVDALYIGMAGTLTGLLLYGLTQILQAGKKEAL